MGRGVDGWMGCTSGLGVWREVNCWVYMSVGCDCVGIQPPHQLLFFLFSFCFSAGNFLFPTWALWTSIRHNQSGVNIGLREDTHRETLTMSSCNIRKTQRGRCREERERRNEPRTLS